MAVPYTPVRASTLSGYQSLVNLQPSAARTKRR